MSSAPEYIWVLEREIEQRDGSWAVRNRRHYLDPDHPAIAEQRHAMEIANRNARTRGRPGVRTRLLRYKLDREEPS